MNPGKFRYREENGVATITLDRPDRLNALTLETYRGLVDLFADLQSRETVHVAVLTGTGRAFCSGGDVNEIIGPLLSRNAGGLLEFTRALENLLQVVREAGGGPENIVQMHILVLDKREYLARRREVGEVWRRLMGRHYPAMALLQVAGLLEEEARVEIEGMAVL